MLEAQRRQETLVAVVDPHDAAGPGSTRNMPWLTLENSWNMERAASSRMPSPSQVRGRKERRHSGTSTHGGLRIRLMNPVAQCGIRRTDSKPQVACAATALPGRTRRAMITHQRAIAADWARQYWRPHQFIGAKREDLRGLLSLTLVCDPLSRGDASTSQAGTAGTHRHVQRSVRAWAVGTTFACRKPASDLAGAEGQQCLSPGKKQRLS